MSQERFTRMYFGWTILLLLFTEHSALAQQTIKIEFDNVLNGGKHNDAEGAASISDPQYSLNDVQFSSRGPQGGPAHGAVPSAPPGSKISNRRHSTSTIQPLTSSNHLRPAKK